MAQNTVTRLVYGVVPPAMGEGNNPNRDIANNDDYQLKPTYENLIGVSPESAEWVPMLAERWELNDARDQLTFYLRKGVQFHNGFGEMTAEDVVFSLTDLMSPEGAISGAADALRKSVTRFEIKDPHTLVFHVTPGLSLAFFEGISYGSIGGAIKSKKDWDARGGGSPATPKLDEKPIAGTGPYQFVSRAPGQNVIFAKVPYEHWRKNAEFQELEYRFILEDATRMSALLAGEVHLTGLPSELTDEVAKRGMSVIRSSLPGRRYGISLPGCYYVETWAAGKKSAEVFTSGTYRYPDSPWCNKDLRRAASKAIDRQALDDAFFGGEAEIAHMWYWLPEQTDSWNPEWESKFAEKNGFDPEGAKKILADFGKPVSVKVWANDDIAEAVAGMLTDVGFQVEMVSMDSTQWFASERAREIQNGMEFDNTGSENITGYRPSLYGNSRSGRAIENVEWDTLYENVLTQLDPEKRAVLWRQLGDINFENVPHIALLRTYTEMVANPKVVCGYTFPGANMSDAYAFVEYIEACK